MPPAAAASKEVPMNIVNPVLEEYSGMSLFLEEVALITNPIMRYKVITNGFKDLEELAKKKPEHAQKACSVIRKSTGSVLTKDISIDQELVLKRLIQYCIYIYVVNRELNFEGATEENLNLVGEWFDLKEKEPDPVEIPKFGDSNCKRQWTDAIKAHFALKKGASGLPLGYVTRDNDEGTEDSDEADFGVPSFDEELLLNGRHSGHYFPMDNKLVYYTIKGLVLNSTAYSCIIRYEKTFNGRAAYKALERNYLGPHVTQLIQRHS